MIGLIAEKVSFSWLWPLLSLMTVSGVFESILGGGLMQWKRVVSVVVSLMFTLAVPNLGISQSVDEESQSAILVPASSIELPGDVGHRAHTNHLIKFDHKASHGGGGSPSGETPASLRSVYNLPSSLVIGGGGVIAIVDAFDYPTAEND